MATARRIKRLRDQRIVTSATEVLSIKAAWMTRERCRLFRPIQVADCDEKCSRPIPGGGLLGGSSACNTVTPASISVQRVLSE